MIWGLASVAALIALAPFARDRLRPTMGAEARQSAPGEFADLPRGRIHYRLAGPEDGPLVILIHGLTTPSFVWTPIADHLNGQGFRTLSYDHYGRGYSDRPGGAQDEEFFLSHLSELLDHLGLCGPATVMGYSMGGAIATAWTARHPDLARDLILLAPAGLGHDLGPVARLVANHNWVGRWLMHLTYARSFRASVEAERDIETSQIPNVVPLQLNELRYRGFIPAVTSSLHHMLDHDLTEAHRKIAEAGTPLLAIWAAEDEVIPVAGAERLAALNPGARNVIIPEAGHALAYTHSPAVTAALDAAELRR